MLKIVFVGLFVIVAISNFLHNNPNEAAVRTLIVGVLLITLYFILRAAIHAVMRVWKALLLKN